MRTFEEDFLEIAYRQNSQKYIELYDEYAGLRHDVNEYVSEGEKVPDDLMAEHQLYSDKVKQLREFCWIRFGKGHKELYSDGWKYWEWEDALLREQRYGR